MLSTSPIVYIRVLFLCLTLVPLAGIDSVARADEDTVFLEHYGQAVRFYEGGQYQDSIREFQAAYALKQLPRLLLNLGQAHRRLGHAKEALGYYEFYLRVAPNPEPKLKAELDSYIAQTRVLLDAAEKVRKEVGSTKTRPEQAVELALQPKSTVRSQPPAQAETEATPLPPAPPKIPAQTDMQAHVRKPLLPPPPAQPSRLPLYKKWWLWTLAGAAAAGTAAGIAGGVVASRDSGPPQSALGTARVFTLTITH